MTNKEKAQRHKEQVDRVFDVALREAKSLFPIGSEYIVAIALVSILTSALEQAKSTLGYFPR